jgi:HicA toxin of bacterial toxin-antitoxin,
MNGWRWWVHDERHVTRMSRALKALERILSAKGDVSFRDLEVALRILGFRLDRVAGSHHIFVHPSVNRPLSIQPIGKMAKRYQVRQFCDTVREFGLQAETE